MKSEMNLTLDDFLIVQAECCRTWPVPLGVQMGTCGSCSGTPVVTHPVIIIRASAETSSDTLREQSGHPGRV